MDNTLATIQANYEAVKSRVNRAAGKAGRNPEDVLVLAVTKLQSNQTIQAAYDAGLRHFGESYVEEALETMEGLSQLQDAQWEMVGHIQSRKAKFAANTFKRIHSLGSLKLARLLNKHRDPKMGRLEVLLQINLSGEDSKQGLEATDKNAWPEVLALAQEINELENLELTGLMTMPPLFPDPEDNRPYFKLLCEMRAYLNEKDSRLNLKELSMGTSYDFDVAIEEGATIVRLGSVLLGERLLK